MAEREGPDPERGREELARGGDEPAGDPRPGPDPKEGREKLARARADQSAAEPEEGN